MNKDKFIELGTSKKPHGIKGAFLFYLYNSEESVLKNGHEVLLRPFDSSSSLKDSGEFFEIDSIHFGNKTICYLKGIRDRNVVEQMLPFKILFDRDKFPNLEQGEWYLDDLVGLEVFNQDGVKLGLVESFYDNGAQVVLKLKISGKKLELPFVEAFFPFVDIEKKKIVLIEPEYD